MADHTSFTGSIPDLYDRYLAAAFMEPYARDLAARVRVEPGGRALEIACGTGRLTRHLAASLPPGVSIDATDLNDAMIAVAQQRVPAPNVRWRQADVTALPFDDRTFGAAACQFGVMFFPDKVAAAREVRRVLSPGGSFWLNTWASLDHNPVANIARETFAELFGGRPPAFQQIPFSYHDPDRIAGDLRSAGFGTVDVTAVDMTGEASVRDLAMGLVQGTPMVLELRERSTVPAEAVTEMLADRLRRTYGGDTVRSAMRAFVAHAKS
jgi:ubiquinone/menaquinone biosynthesis C-methylase UbiE